MASKIIKHCRTCNEEFESWVCHEKKYCCSWCYWDSMKGKEFPNRETPEQIKQRMMGEKNPMWKGGDSDKERRNRDYKNWRILVFKRDGFTCQKCGYFNGCGEKRKDLNVHHVVGWTESIELRYELDNGVTLCVPCHIKTHTDKN